ncbi:hypothetical protein Cfor_00898 [Coptotermes formosanus]|jgi:hypothetical protein|uniref:Mos1 transposase HTH domain-containing protein n=1 Tax=Coptotermes formosanus TaxID=36987 RepID=A0A6L2PG77_COPFO|nr:hypothetical protein Cfor_00898 [Coptotermes formosanus]
MTDVKEQRICIKFCFKFGTTAAETHQMLKEAFGDNALDQTQTYEWFKRFKNGWVSVDDDERSGRPLTRTTTENVAKVRQAKREDRRRTIHDACNIVELSYGTCPRILSDELNLPCIAAKFVQWLTSNYQKEQCIAVYTELKEQAENNPNFNVITGDETWLFRYDLVTKQQSYPWKTPTSPRPKKAQQVRSNVRSMLICFLTLKALCIRNLFLQDRR